MAIATPTSAAVPAARRGVADYDSDLGGPLFAVSDEGSAAQTILDAAYASAKARAMPSADWFTLGVILDGERMTSAGEAPIGPLEYHALSSVAAGQLMLTTNVGVRVNPRLAQQPPEFVVTKKSLADPQWFDNVFQAFEPFLKTPDGHPRPLTARLSVPPGTSLASLKAIVKKLEAGRARGRLGPPKVHCFSVLTVFEDEIRSEAQFLWIERLMQAAKAAGLREVVLDGELQDAARKRLAVQSLLNILDVEPLRRLLRAARQHELQLSYRYQLDIESATRTIWTGLEAARTQGFTAGKYGLVPLTLEEQAVAIELLTEWTAGWSAIPAFYVDTPLITATDVFDSSQCEAAARIWLKMARGAGATVVLFDCPDRVAPRRLIRSSAQDNGVLTIDEVARIADYARELGVSVLWSGGIASRPAFELAKRRVFGIFSTSSTADKVAVTAQFERDPRMAAENEPTEFGVRRMHAIVQGGFLTTALRQSDRALSEAIESLTERLLDAEGDVTKSEAELKLLNTELVRGWRTIAGESHPSRSIGRVPERAPRPVAASAVRVFRGKKQAALGRGDFVKKLGSVFMPMTVQMQRLYGLTAYLPAVLPEGDHGLPDEIALVFYRTQGAYQEAKRCIGGRAYGELHNLVFDMPASPSEFPQLFAGEIVANRAYHAWDRSVDWQLGVVRLYAGRRRAQVKPDVFLTSFGRIVGQLQQTPGRLDAAIFCATKDWLIWWDHSPHCLGLKFEFNEFADEVFAAYPRRLRVPHDLADPYAGVTLNAKGDFVNFQFQRI